MNHKELEKHIYREIKSLSKTNGWKFKSHFIFKIEEKLFYSGYFYINGKNSNISGTLEYKWYGLDSVFWGVINEKDNQNAPLSFSADAAFKVPLKTLLNFSVEISDIESIEQVLSKVLADFELEIEKNNKAIQTLKSYTSHVEEDSLWVALLTAFVQNKEYDLAIQKVSELRAKGETSTYTFGNKDFYDLVLKHIKRDKRRSWWSKFTCY